MTDIVERLRNFVAGDALLAEEAIAEAADEIERLRNERKNCPPVSESEYVRRLEDEIERLRAVLHDETRLSEGLRNELRRYTEGKVPKP